ncbi:histidine kinase [Pontibacter qinzhouensis]|uniref:Histidine kinase n=1 Tax=Pontibacter qinzhouensis TaxID=2603253 RepID=A0A5C8K949_9BACT|nr:sensor histidine kinase [Pontibacter qinzhouensis]TXK48757.1 histidine kinase [Pontibacter qinzhouensis]
MQKAKVTTIVSHVVGWAIFLCLPMLFLSQQRTSADILQLLSQPSYWLFSLSYIILFYAHTYWLFTRFFARKKYMAYSLSVLLLLVLFVLLRPFDRLVTQDRGELRQPPIASMPGPPAPRAAPMPRPGPPPMPPRQRVHFDVTSIFLFCMLIAMGLAIQTVQRLRESEKRALVAETDKAKAELSFLKAQINPHFLFNTLNNIYSLAVTESEHTAGAIMKLSNIMRYVTDEVTAEFVPLESEVACIKDFIDLQRLRVSKFVEVAYAEEGDLSRRQVPPMVLMTFVENVFKYGISNHEPATINIKLKAEDHQIYFFCRNKLFKTRRQVVSTGVGLANTRQRLMHLYPGRHELLILEDAGFFTVELTLQT